MPNTPQLPEREPWFLRFHDLMPFRVREVLLVSSAYDAFVLEEDARLSEQLLTQYSELNLSQAPRIIHVTSAARAMVLLRERRFDLVVTVLRLADADAESFVADVKVHFPSLPVLLLVFDETDMRQCPPGSGPAGVDATLHWTGDSRILIAGIKLIEDARNVEHDTAAAGVQVIIVVEDAIHRYSSFLTLLYPELLSHANSLIAEGFNPMHKLMRLRARPKVLLATTYEDAEAAFERFRDQVMALITDVRFPRGGREDPSAGFTLVRRVRGEDTGLPILMQSAEPENARGAAALGCAYADKNSLDLLARIREFLRERLGFGEFVFRLPDGTEVGRARDMYDMEQALRVVPTESVAYHARGNHFSMWLRARCLFPQADRIRARSLAEFADVEDARQFLIDVLEMARHQEHAGMITDFAAGHAGGEGPFMRLSSGSIGGKGRGIAFVNSILERRGLVDRFPGLEVRVPRTVVIGTDAFDAFMERRRWRTMDGSSDAERVADFLATPLPPELVTDLSSALGHLRGPLAVRSSSLLEDSRYQPFAGIYDTWILPNADADPDVRFDEVCNAVRAVYASTFCAAARAYLRRTQHSIEEEKMGIAIQEVVGQRFGDRFYPHLSGVAQSLNYYPVAPQRAEDGVVLLALGLGHHVVSGGRCLRFSPAAPGVLPHLASVRDVVRASQRTFCALDMRQTRRDFTTGGESSMARFDLAAAETDGTLALVGSVYCEEDDVIRDTLHRPGPRVVTMNNVLKWQAIPLGEALLDLLRVFRRAMGGEIEIEFAVDMGDWGRHAERGGRRREPSLAVLQIRPMTTCGLDVEDEAILVPPSRVLCRTSTALGHGVIDDLRDVVYVTATALDGFSTRAVAAEVGAVNAGLRAEGRGYVLIGPGRWGTADPALGIPTEWAQISGARVIVEVPFGVRAVEPSQGTHFFMNMTSLGIGYLSVPGGVDDPDHPGAFFDRAWLDAQPAQSTSAHVRHVRFDPPLRAELHGPGGVARILKPDGD